MVTGEDLKKVLANFATGVTVVTTLEDDGTAHGMTANAFSSVSLQPPLVLLCVDHKANTHTLIRKQGRFGINILSQGQQRLAEYFAMKQKCAQDAPGSCTLTTSGVPRLDGCLAFLGCQVVGAHEYGDHTIFVARVEEADVNSGQPLLYFRRGYRHMDLDGDRS